MQFDAQDYPYASKRHVVYARNGMVCAGNPTATAAGLKTLLKGGNAIDAAVTVATTLPVVEPTGNGLGADCFAIIWYKGKMYGINASGPAPKANSIAALQARGYDKIPSYGVEPINVPGAVAGWMAMHERFGSLDLGGNARQAGKSIDIGAFEYQPMAEGRIRYVRPGGTGSGTSWDDAAGNIQAMIDDLADNNPQQLPGEVWVARGEYEPQSYVISGMNYSASFRMRSGISVYGGFAGDEASKTEREKGAMPWQYDNETILSAAYYDHANLAYSSNRCPKGSYGLYRRCPDHDGGRACYSYRCA